MGHRMLKCDWKKGGVWNVNRDKCEERKKRDGGGIVRGGGEGEKQEKEEEEDEEEEEIKVENKWRETGDGEMESILGMKFGTRRGEVR